jgi:putative methyltransferase (TIGR04325 family)
MLSRVKRFLKGHQFGWSGDYKTWQDVSAITTKYDSAAILNKVKEALLEVKNGKAAFERDSVLFYEIEYNWQVLTALFFAFAKESRLTILDFGGSLGSTYFQHYKLLSDFSYTWNIVEQEHFIKEGRNTFQNDRLKFFNKIEDVPRVDSTFLMLSSVLPYLEHPYEWLTKFISLKPEYIFVDRTGFVTRGKDRLTLQRVPEEIYKASYPCWFLDRAKFLSFFAADYELIFQHKNDEKAIFESEFLGFLFKRRK